MEDISTAARSSTKGRHMLAAEGYENLTRPSSPNIDQLFHVTSESTTHVEESDFDNVFGEALGC